jgi:hypothetical protein
MPRRYGFSEYHGNGGTQWQGSMISGKWAVRNWQHKTSDYSRLYASSDHQSSDHQPLATEQLPLIDCPRVPPLATHSRCRATL